MKHSKLLLCLAAFTLTAGAQTPRSLCLFFDLNSMTTAEQVRAQASAVKFVQQQMTASDVVSVMTSAPTLTVIQDFTGNRETLLAALRTIVPSPAGAGAAEPIPTAEDRLRAIQDAAAILTPVAGKKALIYFSAGALQTGATNQRQLTATVNAAVRANLAFYPVDARTVGGDALLPLR